jgi:uncharacterized membrane protein YjdF
MDQKSDRRQMAIYLAVIFIVACAIIGGGVSWWNASRTGGSERAAIDAETTP